jgi:hypothetical protein
VDGDNIKIDVKQIHCEFVYWIRLSESGVIQW